MTTSSSAPAAEAGAGQGRRAAVLGYPIEHSRSPDLHRAAYRALGLTGWTYERIECRAGELAGVVDGLDDSYVGVSVTMPGKAEALAYADEATERARLVGSANTLVRDDGKSDRPDGWLADCTDIDGVAGALTAVGADFVANPRAVLLGAGGTARPTLAALADAGAREVAVVVRDASRASAALDLAEQLSLAARVVGFGDEPALTEAFAASGVVVSTVPADAAAAVTGAVNTPLRLVDAIYSPWPTPLAARVAETGGTVIGGLVMLLNQAFRQVELFTGQPAPREAMAAALSTDAADPQER
ncbi:shikimate dehydrogenase [Gordonia araii NBRC 100433]|uniref:Shikimate dehydrogenase n=1 Tax=Gordonia araii NBRC 100433 TaxID=1073574 RepID=G7H5E6_9ACTN|nr:shikimate dehydrogenase [Gordonia araii]NNG95785.1 shikimate dehydrogenase [Gordonia araii NBRC 100433]GAB11071.1 shikimate dehydrogenase [Gordonia araii NBRC 100433]